MAKTPKKSQEKGRHPAEVQPGYETMPPPPVKRPVGNQTTFDQAIADDICARLGRGETLRAICRDEGYPPESTVRQWVVDDRQGFAAQYMRARDIGLDAMADEILDISDKPMMGEKIKTTGEGDKATKEVTQGDMVERSRLRLEARKWYLSKAAPKRYGDRVAHEHSGGITLEALVMGSIKKPDGEETK